MTVIKRAPKPAVESPAEERAATKAAASAPDSKARKVKTGKQEMFQVGFDPELMALFEAERMKLGLSRPAMVRLAVRTMINPKTA